MKYVALIVLLSSFALAAPQKHSKAYDSCQTTKNEAIAISAEHADVTELIKLRQEIDVCAYSHTSELSKDDLTLFMWGATVVRTEINKRIMTQLEQNLQNALAE